jgi:putative transposase
VGRQRIFADEQDYLAFQTVMQETRRQVPMRLLAYCIMPNHWHLVLWPRAEEDLSAYMHWLTMTHTQRWHAFHGTTGTGPLYQGRFKSFAVEADNHFYAVCRYVERNPLRAGLVSRAEAWRWSSLWQYQNERCEVELDAWPLPRPQLWVEHVNAVETEAELAAIRASVTRGKPFGGEDWTLNTAKRLGMVSSLRARGRPRSME